MSEEGYHVNILDRFYSISGGSRIFERWSPSVVDHRCRGVGVQPPTAEEVLFFTSIQSIEKYNILYL